MPPDRLERVTDLLLVLLDARHPLSLREIADRVPGYPQGHGARRQAFERDKRLLRDEGVPVLVEPIDGDDQLGYRVDREQFYLPDLVLDPEEQAALNLAVAGVHLGQPTAEDALSKLGTGAGYGAAADTSRAVLAPTPVVDLPAGGLARLALVHDALRDSAVVEFVYRGRPRTVDPGGLRFTRGQWYLVGRDRGHGEARTFRVDRMESQPVRGETGSSELPADFDVVASFTLEPWRFGASAEVPVDVLVDAVEAGRVISELGSDAVAERQSDGGVVAHLAVTDEDAFVEWLLGLLDHGEVLRPEDLRRRVIDRLEALAAGEDAGRRDERGTEARNAPPAVTAVSEADRQTWEGGTPRPANPGADR